MKKYLYPLVVLCLSLSLLACGQAADGSQTGDTQTETAPFTEVDYAAAVKLDMSSASVKQEVTVKAFVDGDTTHFHVPTSVSSSGVLKARYLAINTPESTGKIEEWGKAASAFTKEKLSSAVSIVIESDDGNWNLDSTGGRYLVWVWYKTATDTEYRNLNIEILQNGLAIASSAANNRYGSTCTAAIAQAKTMKLHIYSGQKDPDFYYGEAVELTLKELRCHPEAYNGVKVAFEGVITRNNDNTVYVEAYDEETDMYYGMAVYYGFGLTGEGLNILSVGNLSRIVGTVQYYETGGTWQVSGLTYRQMKPDDPGNIQKISDGHTGAFRLITPETFAEGKVTVETEEGSEAFGFAALAMNTTVSMENLTVRQVYTTSSTESSSYGAMTLTCEADGKTITVRTNVLRDASGDLVTAEAYEGKVIDVRGLVDYYDGTYQIRVFTTDDITVHS